MVVRCELEVGDSHNFPPNPGRGVTSHRIEPQKSRRPELPETLEKGWSRFSSFTNFTRDSTPIVSRSHGCQGPIQQISTTASHLCSQNSFLSSEFTYTRHPPDIALITRISHRFHQEFMSPVGSSAYLGVNLVRYIWPLTSSVTPAGRHSKPPRPQWPKSTADTYFRFGRLCPPGRRWPC